MLHGAGLTTLDLDVVPRRTSQNAQRLLGVLRQLDARILDPMNRVIRPRAADFQGTGQIKMTTTLGPLDVLCQLHDGRGFDQLVGHSRRLGTVRVLDLPTLLEVKSSTGRAKDRVVLPILLALVEREE